MIPSHKRRERLIISKYFPSMDDDPLGISTSHFDSHDLFPSSNLQDVPMDLGGPSIPTLPSNILIMKLIIVLVLRKYWMHNRTTMAILSVFSLPFSF